MRYKFSELVSMKELQELIESIYLMTGISCFIREMKLSTIDFTTSKNRSVKPYRRKGSAIFRCCNGERKILQQIKNGKSYGVCQCESGLVYMGAPIVIKGTHVATILTEKVFMKEPDIEYFRLKARKLNFNENEYLKTIKKINVISKKQAISSINFFCKIAKTIGELGYKNLKEIEANRRLSENYMELSNACRQFSVAEKELRHQYEEMEKMAYYDLVTNLPNWNFFRKRLSEYIDSVNEKFAIFKVDLDNFKNLNDTYGHDHGDKLLRNMGEAIQKQLGKGFVVSRTSGDEFLVLQPNIGDKLDASKSAEKILETLSGLWEIDEKEFFASVSVGITVYPDDGGDVAGILRNADIAVNKAKESGKNSYRFFEISMYEEILRKAELEKQLRKAIKNNEFMLYYQPQVHLETRRVVSFEALIRWNNKKFGWVSPGEFISLAEETGIIIPIGEWVLRTACLQGKEWRAKGYSYDFISVNVSTIQIQNSDFVSMVKNVLKETGTEPQSLEIEITESVMMQSLDLNLSALNELRRMGVRVALDDFGTGYSSLNYLKSLPINTLKIDKTFVDGLCKNSYEEIITEQIINLAHKMHLEVVAEGVELEEQLRSLEGKRCNKIQGYYFAKPLPPEEICSFFQEAL